MKRSLGELKMRAGMFLSSSVNNDLREKCIGIASEKSPSAAFKLANQTAFASGLDQMQALGVAKATRWLAVIRRDYDNQDFQEVVVELKKLAKGT